LASGVDARSVRGDQDIGRQGIFFHTADFMQPGRAHFLTHFDEYLGVESQLLALFYDAAQGGQIDGVLALVVGRSATVPAVTFFNHLPGV
jgi:hypothetical protein